MPRYGVIFLQDNAWPKIAGVGMTNIRSMQMHERMQGLYIRAERNLGNEAGCQKSTVVFVEIRSPGTFNSL